ncbi:MAG: hypothetical protein GW946_03495, partial [Candidatus Pacebacteria bacterium]|nr:hypothetical protein [Candidatus Paceibacterota bacterium]
NLTREEQSVCSTGASDRVGELFGPVPKGGEIKVRTNPGPIRLDLLAFEKVGSCEGDFALEKLGPGKFQAQLAGQSHDPIWLVSTKQFEAAPGSQNVTMDVLGTSENEMGVSLACDDSKKPQVTSVATTGSNQVVITGTNLAETSRVSIKGLGTNFEIVS